MTVRKTRLGGIVGGIVLALVSAACGTTESGSGTAGAARASAHPSEKPANASARDETPSFAWRGPMQDDWLSWRGPHQNGTSDDARAPLAIDPAQPLWTLPISGRGTPVIADGLVYAMGYQGEDATCVEMLVCLDERDGTILWQELFPDFLSDVVYSRYSISSPTLDPETGNVYCQTSPGRVIAYTRGGKKLWEHSMMEEYGKLTFPNGRTGAPLVVGDKLIVHVITASWGPLAPARDRFYAFDKRTGECIWGGATPGEMPQDNSFSFPIVFEREGRWLLAAETGCGHLAVLDVATGDPLWRFRIGSGANSSPVLTREEGGGDVLIGVHGNENADDSSIGRLIAVNLGELPKCGEKLVEPKDAERWRVDLEAFSSSPVVAGQRLFLSDEDGELACVNVESGALLWKHKLAPDQVHASPLFAAGRLYVPMNNGSFHILAPSDQGPEVLDQDQLEGNCLGAPALANGRLYVHTTAKLYCFGGSTAHADVPAPAQPAAGAPGPAVRLQIVPGDFALQAGAAFSLRARTLDAAGRVLADPAEGVTFATDLPLQEDAPSRWSVARDARPGANVLKAEAAGLKAEARVRIVPALPYREDFEQAKLDQPKPDAPSEQLFGFPPSFYLSGRSKWDVRQKDGSQVLARTIDNPLFQRTISLLGDEGDTDYSVQADVMVEGNRRGMASVGIVHQRYLIYLKGNYQQLEVSSNFESLKVNAPFPIEAGQWYTLKSRVDLAPDGSALVRAKCWPRGTDEPEGWTIEVPHRHAHQNGAVGLYGFTIQNRFKAYVDNLQVTPNE
ncbi:MAG: PQQ-binding-like beta-propeller repeat protein [Planctomycetes bacterium]|nr:PQQ-binding-like beta-propeller repeat protein [Planctomycetota bacterium]